MTPWTGSSVHGVSKSRILEWAVIFFSRRSSQSRYQTCTSCIGRWILYHWATREALAWVCFMTESPPGQPLTPGIDRTDDQAGSVWKPWCISVNCWGTLPDGFPGMQHRCWLFLSKRQGVKEKSQGLWLSSWADLASHVSGQGQAFHARSAICTVAC